MDNLRVQVETALATSRHHPLDHQPLLDLARDCHALWLLGLWLRDAAVALARSADPEVGWRELEDATDVSDSTMSSRLVTWRGTEALR